MELIKMPVASWPSYFQSDVASHWRGRWVTPVASRPEGVWPHCSPGLVSYSLFASSLLSGILVVFRWARHTSTLGPLHWLFRLPNIVPLNWVCGSNVTSVRLILTPFPFLKCNSFLRNFLHPFPAFFFPLIALPCSIYTSQTFVNFLFSSAGFW